MRGLKKPGLVRLYPSKNLSVLSMAPGWLGRGSLTFQSPADTHSAAIYPPQTLKAQVGLRGGRVEKGTENEA